VDSRNKRHFAFIKSHPHKCLIADLTLHSPTCLNYPYARAIYYFMPVGRLPSEHALIGGATAGLLWAPISAAGFVFVLVPSIGC